MADLTRIQADLPTMLVGATSSGTPATPIDSDLNGNLFVVDSIQSSIVNGNITVGTTAVAANVSGSNLSNRKTLTISPQTGIVYIGASGVTTSNGIPIYAGQVGTFSFSANVTAYLIASTSTVVSVLEGA